jgi:hypothetical protein
MLPVGKFLRSLLAPLALQRHQMKHLDFLILLLDSRHSSLSSYSASCWTYGIARCVYPENASQEDSTGELMWRSLQCVSRRGRFFVDRGVALSLLQAPL